MMDDGGPWYWCDACKLDWQAPGSPNPKDCPECEREGRKLTEEEVRKLDGN